jgi:transposase
VNECADQLEPAGSAVKSALIHSDAAGFDESGLKVKGEKQRAHVCSTEKLTRYELHEKRGKEAMEAVGILPRFEGAAIHGRWKSYLQFDDIRHALCNARHLRELNFIVEQYDQKWAGDMIELLAEINHSVKQAPPDAASLEPDLLLQFEKRCDDILEKGFEMNPPPVKIPGKRGRPKQSPPKSLPDRLRSFKKETLRFMYDFRVPFDNNQSERDIRMIKVKQKVSGTFRTVEGAQRFCGIRGYISAAKKNAVNVMDAIKSVFNGSPFIPSIS